MTVKIPDNSGSEHVTKTLDRKLGLLSVFAISLGAMMGSGIFVLPGYAAGHAGPYVALSYLLAGVLVLPAVFSKAELATAMPVAGGTYVYVDRSMGPWMGTIAGLGTWFSLSAKTAFALVGLSAYMSLFTSLPLLPFALALLSILLVLNVIGVGKVSGLQIVIVTITVMALLMFAGLAAPNAKLELLQPALPMGLRGIVEGAGFVFVSYSGVTKVCSIAEEVKNPSRNIPLGMFSAVFTAMALYAIIATVITTSVDYSTLHHDTTPVATAAKAALGPTGEVVMAVVAMVGLISMCNAGVLASTRFPLAMARGQLLPERIREISPRFGTPLPAIILTGLLLVVLVTSLPVVKLAKLASAFKIFVFGIVNLSVIILRETGPRWYRPTFRSPLYPWMQIAGMLGAVLLLTNMGTLAIAGVTGSILVGSGWYFGYAKSRAKRRSAMQHLFGEATTLRRTQLAELEEARPDQPPRVIVPVFGSEPAPARLVRLAAAFAEDSVLEVLRLEEVPEQAGLTDYLAPDDATLRLAEHSAAIGEDARVDVEFRDLVTHNAKEALTSHAIATSADWIVIERPEPRRLRAVVRYPMAWWFEHAPCDLGIFLDRGGVEDLDTRDDFPRILILAEPGPYDSLVVHVADRLARGQRGGRLTLFEPVGPDASDAEIAAHEAYHEQLGGQCRSPWTSKVVRGDSELQAIAEVSADYDLLILGAPPESGLSTLFFGSRQHRIVDAAVCSVLKVRAPRHKVHDRFRFADETTAESLAIEPHVLGGVFLPNLQLDTKAELLSQIAQALSPVGQVTTSETEKALWDRERQQNTGLSGGVVLTDPVLHGLESPVLGIFTTAKPVDFSTKDGQEMDVVIAVMASPGDRQTQLWLLGRMNALIATGGLLTELRKARSGEALRNAIRHAEERAVEEAVS